MIEYEIFLNMAYNKYTEEEMFYFSLKYPNVFLAYKKLRKTQKEYPSVVFDFTKNYDIVYFYSVHINYPSFRKLEIQKIKEITKDGLLIFENTLEGYIDFEKIHWNYHENKEDVLK